MRFRISVRVLLLAMMVSAMMVVGDLYAQVWIIQTPFESHYVTTNNGRISDYPTVNLPVGMQYWIHASGAEKSPSNSELTDAHYYTKTGLPFPIASGGIVSVGVRMMTSAHSAPSFLQSAIAMSYASSHDYVHPPYNSPGAALAFDYYDREAYPGTGNYYSDNTDSILIEVAQYTPQLAVKDSVIDFGNVDFRLSPAVRLDSIESYGKGTFSVDRLDITGSTDFTILSAQRGVGAFTLPEMATNQIVIGFSPTILGPQTALLHIRSAGAYGRDKDRTILLKAVGHGPILSVLPDTIHFGNVAILSNATKPARFYNAGDTSALLQSLTYSPATPFSTGPVLPVALLKNDTTLVSIRYSPTVVGYNVSKVTVGADDPFHSLSFYVDGTGVAPSAKLSPKDTLDFGTVIVLASKTLGDTVINTGLIDVGVTKYTLTNTTDFSVSGAAANIPPGGRQTYLVTFTPQTHTANGIHNGSLQFTLGDGSTLQVELLGRDSVLKGAASLNPQDTIDFGTLALLASNTLGDTLRNIGPGNLDVTSYALSASPDFSITGRAAPFTLATTASETYLLTFSPQTAAPPTRLHSAILTFTFGDLSQKKVVLIGHDAPPKPGIAVVSPKDTLDFGTIALLATKSLGDTVTNIGTGDLTVTSILVGGLDAADFTLAGPAGAYALQPVKTAAYTISFRPTAVTGTHVHVGTLTFAFGDGTTKSVVLIGRDIPPATGIASLNPKDTLDFGALVLLDRRTLGEFIKNIGGGDLAVTKYTLTNPADFSVNGPGGAYTLMPDSVSYYGITFLPLTHTPNNIHLGSIIFTFGDGSTKLVTLIGRDHVPITTDLYIGKWYHDTASGQVVIIQTLMTDISTTLDPVISFSESIKFDPKLLSLVRVETGSVLPKANWTLAPTTTTAPGQVDVRGFSNGPGVKGPGEFLRFLLAVSPNAKTGDTSSIAQFNVSFGGGFEPLATTETGKFTVIDFCSPVFVSTTNIATSVEQNAPNPFNPTTDIQFHVGAEGTNGEHVTLRLYNALGELVRVLADGEYTTGSYVSHLDAHTLGSGVYWYTFDAGSVHKVKQMVLAK